MDFEAAAHIPPGCPNKSFQEEKYTSSDSSESVKPRKKRASRRIYFSMPEKRMLITQVKQHPCIWDVSDRYHSSAAVIGSAWKTVSSAVGRSIQDCKSVWMSLRRAKMYHDKKQQSKVKSGDNGGQATEAPVIMHNKADDLRSLQHLDSLPQTSENRRTTEYSILSNDRRPVDEVNESDSSENTSNHSYANSNAVETSIARMAASIEKFVEFQCSQVKPQVPPVEHYSLAVYIDSMLKRLSPREVLETELEIIKLLHDKIMKKHDLA